MITLRPFHPGEEPALRAVFESAIHEVARRDCTSSQVDAWAPRDHDARQWARRMQDIAPFVVERDGEIVAYADLQPSGCIDHFYVAAAAGRQGIGALLMRRLHEQAVELGLPVLSSHVSPTAQPFFARFGFAVVEHRRVIVRGVEMRNAAMKKVLCPQPENP